MKSEKKSDVPKRGFWRRLIKLVLFMSFVAVCCLVFVSNHFFYLSHQRFPVLEGIQWNHKASSDVMRGRPVIVGHRGSGLRSTALGGGVHDRLIGNTKKSIEAAIAAKADWLEIDIQVSEDGELVVFHDAEIDAKTTLSGKVAELTWEELAACDVLVDPPEKILALEEVFDTFHSDQQHWMLDVKVLGISEEVIAQIERSKVAKEQVIIFGNHEVLEGYKGKGYRLGYTTLFGSHQSMIYSLSDVFECCADNGYDLLVVPIVFVTTKLVTGAREHDLDVWCYDSNDPRDLEYAAGCGVKGLIVDDPEAVVSQFENWGVLPE